MERKWAKLTDEEVSLGESAIAKAFGPEAHAMFMIPKESLEVVN